MTSATIAGFEFTISVGDGVIVNPRHINLINNRLKTFGVQLPFEMGGAV